MEPKEKDCCVGQTTADVVVSPMEECAVCDLETEYKLLDELLVINAVRVDEVAERTSSTRPSGRRTGRVICTLWCSANHPPGDLRQPSVKVNQSTTPDIEHAMRAVRNKITKNHSGLPP